MKKILMSLIVLLSFIMGCTKSYDNNLVEQGRRVVRTYGVDKSVSFEVHHEEGLKYQISFNGTSSSIEFVKQNELEEVNYHGTEVTDERIFKIFEEGKKIVIDYINKSNILENKEYLKEKILSVDIKFGAQVGAAEYYDGTVYINADQKEYLCQWVIVHELVHYLSELTHNGFENKVYACSYFDETLTDLITSSMNPSRTTQTGIELETAYMKYYDIVLSYIGSFGEMAIKAYFYGYDDLYQTVGEDEMYVFVRALDAYFEQNNSAMIVELLLNKWAIEIY